MKYEMYTIFDKRQNTALRLAKWIDVTVSKDNTVL